MKAVIQKVVHCSVKVNNEIISSIGKGIFVLIGIYRHDTEEDLKYLVSKILNTRLFEDGGKKWNKSVTSMDYEIMCVSQFTLCHNLKGNKLDFHLAMKADESKLFYEKLLNQLRLQYKPDKVKDGQFGAHMMIDLCNDGPVTIEISSKSTKEHSKQIDNVTSEVAQS